jgi:hypothetical protein
MGGALAVGLVGSGCSGPSVKTCVDDRGCTSGQICVNGLCTVDSRDAGSDAGKADSGVTEDAGVDAGIDPGTDAGLDAGTDAGTDPGTDAGLDAGTDAGVVPGTDAGVDAGPPNNWDQMNWETGHWQ